MLHWRLKIRAAHQAIHAGRFEEAFGLLTDTQLREYLPAQQLADQLASRYAERAAQRMQWGQSSAGFADLAVLDRLGSGSERADQIRQAYARQAETKAEQRLADGNPMAAAELVQKTAQHGIYSDQLHQLESLAELWQTALQLAQRGESQPAQATIDRAYQLAKALAAVGNGDVLGTVQNVAKQIGKDSEKLTRLRDQIHNSAIKKDWPATLRLADQALQLAPRDGSILGLRRRAWRELELDKTRPLGSKRVERFMTHQPSHSQTARRLAQSIRESTHAGTSKQDTSVGKPATVKRMLWVDAVGGYLMLLDDQITIGQPAGTAGPDLPILADLSRRHAKLLRDKGSYVLEPMGPTQLDGKLITEPTVLANDHQICLGHGVKLHFRRPHALSATAQLTVTSGHRTAPSCDAVLLMAESCVLGNNSHCHVPCRGLEQPIILYRQEGHLACRSELELAMNGQEVNGAIQLSHGDRAEGQDFAFSLEELS